jgi:hypothetical protein
VATTSRKKSVMVDDSASTILAIVMIVLLVGCCILLCHHHYHHRLGGPEPLKEPMDRWFQLSDVGNFHSCSHEMWCMGLEFAAACIAIYAIATTEWEKAIAQAQK